MDFIKSQNYFYTKIHCLYSFYYFPGMLSGCSHYYCRVQGLIPKELDSFVRFLELSTTAG